MYIYRGKLKFGSAADNEGITVTFPLDFRLGCPVYTCWQWSVKDEHEKVHSFCTGTIDELTISSELTKVGFNYDGDYSFDAISDGIKKLSLTMRAKSGDASDQTDLHLVYRADPSVVSGPIDLRIYVGKLRNWAPFAVDEMLVIVIPGSIGEGNTICAFWQWTVDYRGITKVNVDDVTKISDVEIVEDVGVSLRFYQANNNYYTFDARVHETLGQLTLTMENPQSQSTGDLIFDLQDLRLPPGRRRHALLDHTTKVFNDTSEIIVCSLSSSSTILTDKTLATALLTLGGVGLSTVLTPGVSPTLSTFVTTASFNAAFGGATQVFMPSGNHTSAVLFPCDMMKRTSSGSLFISNSNIRINLIRVDNSRRLVVSTATVENVGAEMKNLSEFLPGNKSAPAYGELLTIMLPSDMRLMAYRNIIVRGLTVTRTARNIEDMKESDIPNALTTFVKSTSQLKWHGTLDTYYDTFRESEIRDPTLFEHSSDDDLIFSQVISRSSHAKVLNTETDDGSGELILLKLDHCTIGDRYRSRMPLPDCQDEDGIKFTIAKNRGYWAYTWSAETKKLSGYIANSNTPVLYSSAPHDCVVFVTKSSNPVLGLVAK